MAQTIEVTKEMGKRIMELREKRGWTQTVLAAKAGLAGDHICRLEKGCKTRRPTLTGDMIAKEQEIAAKRPKKCCSFERVTCALEELIYRAGIIAAASNYRMRDFDLLAQASYLAYCRRHPSHASHVGVLLRAINRVKELRAMNEGGTSPVDTPTPPRHHGRRR